MSVLLASIAALLFGTADFAGGAASRRDSVSAVLIWSQLAGLVLVLGFAAIDPQSNFVAGADLLWGAVAGIGGMGGLAFLYRGLSRGYVSIVSPLAALLGAAVPVVFGLAFGESLSTTAMVGILIALPAIVLMSWNTTGAVTHRDPGRLRRSWIDGTVSGGMFGLFFIAISLPAPETGMWPLAAARLTSITVMAVGATVAGRGHRIEGGWALVAVAGLLDMGANIAFVLALRHGLLAVVTVIASAYPAQTVILSRVFLNERIGLIRGTGDRSPPSPESPSCRCSSSADGFR
jgi:drug/metabolite transporter (DMT)-like permease